VTKLHATIALAAAIVRVSKINYEQKRKKNCTLEGNFCELFEKKNFSFRPQDYATWLLLLRSSPFFTVLNVIKGLLDGMQLQICVISNYIEEQQLRKRILNVITR
jgi:hypothetical protein